MTGPSVAPRLALHGIAKSFGGIRALKGVSFDIRPGEIRALLGENGAGKSTLVKIVSGLQTADAGEIRLDGALVRFRTPMEARKAGVVAVYQDPKLFPHLDVAENIFMGVQPLDRLGMNPRVLILDEPTHGIDVGTKAQVHRIARSLADSGLAILVISSDLPEVLRMGDRVIVIADGRMTGTFRRGEASQERIMAAASQRSRKAAA